MGTGPMASRSSRLVLLDVMVVMTDKIVDGWLSVRRNDPRAFAFYRRHYSAEKQMKSFRARDTNFMGPGECLVLMTACQRAVFAWQYNIVPRYDGQVGVCCTIFRNEGAGL